MARLNESPAAPAPPAGPNSATSRHSNGGQPATESVEILKRRWVRQNRELAKNNSNQSYRIRSLEIDISRLVADNHELRNQVVQLQNGITAARAEASREAEMMVKNKLRAHVAELVVILDSTEVSDELARGSLPDKKPYYGDWRERQPLRELMRDTLMPTISEEKPYPRRTLGVDEIQAFRLSDPSTNESPELGPPPIPHFDYEDPVKNVSPLVPTPAAPRENSVRDSGDEDLPVTFSINLETRRKRKDVTSKVEIEPSPLIPLSQPKEDDQPPVVPRTGAKRKLADREIDRSVKPPAKSEFTFTRKTSVKTANDEPEKLLPDSSKSDPDKPKEPSMSQSKPGRTALSNKSTNMSPRKTKGISVPPGAEKPEKPPPSRSVSTTRDEAPTRKRRISSIPAAVAVQSESRDTVELPPLPPEVPVVEPINQPNTPAPPDLFSPVSSEPSAKIHEVGRDDTPPPTALGIQLGAKSDAAAAAATARPSRRARSAVNYTEPSLISKMRRPDTKLVDAVSGPSRRATATTAAEAKEKALDNGAMKTEPHDNADKGGRDTWRTLAPQGEEPGSPLSKKIGTRWPDISVPPAAATAAGAELSQTPSSFPSSSSVSLVQLMAQSRKRRESSVNTIADTATVTRQLEDMDIYDFRDSSSPLAPAPQVEASMKKQSLDHKDDDDGKRDDYEGTDAAGAKASSHRRHSSAPKDLVTPGTRMMGPSTGGGGGGGVNGSGTSSIERTAVSRSERAASRRRSMML